VQGGMPRNFGPPTPRPGGPGAGGPGGSSGPRPFGPRPGGPPPSGPRQYGPRPGGPPAGGPGFSGPRQFGPRPAGAPFGGPRRDDAGGRPFRPAGPGGPPPRRFDDRDEPQDNRPRRQGPVGEMLYGRNAVLEALRGGRDIKRVFVATGAHGEVITEIVDTTRARKISLQSVDKRRLDDMAFNHQGVVAEAGPFVYADLADVIAAAKASPAPLVLVLDVLQDPQNLGSLLRTAAAAGAQGVVIPEHRAVGVTPAVVKASAGAIERLKIAQVTNLSRAIEELQEAGLWSVGLDAEGDTPYDQADLVRPLALVVGGEGKGLRQLVRQHCDTIVRLPMPGAIESLNAAVAGSIVLYEALRQRANQPESAPAAAMRPVPQTVVLPPADAVTDEDDEDALIEDSAEVEFVDVDAAEAAAMEAWAGEIVAAETAAAGGIDIEALDSKSDDESESDDDDDDESDDDDDDKSSESAPKAAKPSGD
jgi:23S rRNA (guanosine2251-2'-O)-methyltransferase